MKKKQFYDLSQVYKGRYIYCAFVANFDSEIVMCYYDALNGIFQYLNVIYS